MFLGKYNFHNLLGWVLYDMNNKGHNGLMKMANLMRMAHQFFFDKYCKTLSTTKLLDEDD